MQVFYWIGTPTDRDGKQYYEQFALNNVNYKIGDAVYLFPEDESSLHYVGIIVSAFVDEASGHADPHCIEVKWYERRVNLEQHTKGIEESEREVFELEDTDINPIGCISGPTCIVRAQHYEEAAARMRAVGQTDWFFCRGFFMQNSNQFQPYSTAELAIKDGGVPPILPDLQLPQLELSLPAPSLAPSNRSNQRPAASIASAAGRDTSGQKRQATGRTCVECGATSTPQWREGPLGPKTLCNACGVRYGRIKHKLLKKGSSGASGKNKAGPKGGAGGAGSFGTGGSQQGAASRAANAARKHKEEYDEEDEDVEDEEDEDAASRRPSHRPMRQAAAASLARTAAYARTGEFGGVGDEGGPGLLGGGLNGQGFGTDADFGGTMQQRNGSTQNQLPSLLDFTQTGAFSGTNSNGTLAGLPGLDLTQLTGGAGVLLQGSITHAGLPGSAPAGSAGGLGPLPSFMNAAGGSQPLTPGASLQGGGADPSLPTLSIEPLLVPMADAGVPSLQGQATGAMPGPAPQTGGSGAGPGWGPGSSPSGGIRGPGTSQGSGAAPLDPHDSVHELLAMTTQPALLSHGSEAKPGSELPLHGSPRLLASSLIGSPKSGGHLLNPPMQSHGLLSLMAQPAQQPFVSMSGGHAGAGLLGLGRGGGTGGTLGGSPLSLASHLPGGGNTDLHSLLGITGSGGPFRGGGAPDALPGMPREPGQQGGGTAVAAAVDFDPSVLATRILTKTAAAGAATGTQHDYQVLALKALRYAPELTEVMGMFNMLDTLPGGALPEEARTKMQEVRQMVETASQEAAATEAAVSAVQQVFNARKEVAQRAKDEAAAAGLKLKEYLSELLAQHQLPVQLTSAAGMPAQALGATDSAVAAQAQPAAAAAGVKVETTQAHEVKPDASQPAAAAGAESGTGAVEASAAAVVTTGTTTGTAAATPGSAHPAALSQDAEPSFAGPSAISTTVSAEVVRSLGTGLDTAQASDVSPPIKAEAITA